MSLKILIFKRISMQINLLYVALANYFVSEADQLARLECRDEREGALDASDEDQGVCS